MTVAIVRVAAPQDPRHVDSLPQLPPSPALAWSAFLVGVSRELPLTRVLAWALAVRRTRPGVPIGLIGMLDDDGLRLLGGLESIGVRFEPISPSPTNCSTPSVEGALRRLREATVVGRIADAWAAQWNVTGRASRELLRAIAQHAAQGRRAYTFRHRFRDGSDPSEKTVQRRLRAQGLPTLATLLREGRLLSVRLRVAEGMGFADALALSGWYSADAYRKILSRTACPQTACA